MEKLVVDASKPKWHINLKELWAYRDLFYILAYRDLRVRYAQTFLGLLWAFIQPLATLTIFTVVFGKVAQVETSGVPYPLFAVCGMASWSYFSFVLNQSGNSIIGAQEMVKKIYFPRLVIPLSKALVGFVDFAIALLFVVILMIYYGFIPPANIIYLPIFIVLTIVSALAVGIWLSALTIRYRDFQHVVPFLVQFGLYATPVGYQAKDVIKRLPDWGSFIYYANPMAGIVEGFRWSLLGGDPPSIFAYFSFSIVILLFITGLLYFKRVEKVMADIV
ncbi:ABC transporter permease [Marivirga salinae]|uniref:Transport permease protein n=1 Tax=Marivirga salinarum TaxID=3059078 RepID=A0AA51NBQ2_9BACT|nr:ABC transporter permease [Marivirga sp. BDSF4-3]WMN12193.1 ABC transporter permease [Marivirga sp. BDSF4-3]